MNLNISNFLSSTIKILNTANKALPLIKEINPLFNSFKNKYQKNQITYTNKIHKNNNLTFFNK